MKQPITIIDAKQQFKDWRSNKAAGSSIPTRLWNMVNKMLSEQIYNKSLIVRELRLSAAQLKQKCSNYFLNKNSKKIFKPNTFVKASLTPLITATTAPPPPEIIIERHNQVKLHLTAPSQEQFSTLIKLFME
jgi:hypothetical protein